jgi:flagellar biosynthesis protein FliR
MAMQSTLPIHESLSQLLPLVALIGARMLALCHTFPLLVDTPIPARIRLGFTLLLTVLVAPTATRLGPSLPTSSVWFSSMLQEVIIGMSLGLAVGIILSSVRFVAAMFDAGSLSLWGSLSNDGHDEGASTTGQVFLWVALLAFLSIQGERQVLAAFLDSFVRWPVGTAMPTESVIGGLITLLQTSLMIGWRVAFPIGVATVFGLTSVAMLGRMSSAGSMTIVAIPGLQFASLALLLLSLHWLVGIYGQEIEGLCATLLDQFPRP